MKGWKKWLIFALWCLWYLCNHAATLIQPIWYQRAHDKEGGEREGGRRRREAEFWSKRGRKRATDWEKAGRIIELLGPGVQMRNVGRISSGERLKRQRRGGGRASEREQRCRGRERERRRRGDALQKSASWQGFEPRVAHCTLRLTPACTLTPCAC